MSSVQSTDVDVPVNRGLRARRGAVLGLVIVAVAILLVILLLDLPRAAVGGLTVVSIVLLILIGVHIAVAMSIGALAGLLAIGGPAVVIASVEKIPYGAVANWQYSVVPVFVLMGIALWRSGLSSRAFESARLWFGGLPGGLAVGTSLTGAALASASGNTIGIAYAVGRVGIPEMIRSGYKPSLAIGAVSMTGIIGQIIPPSILLVIYAGMVQTPVGPQLLAGVVPGLVLTVAVCLMILIRSWVSPTLAPRVPQDGVTWGARFKSTLGVLPLALLILVIIGGLLSGVFTATEAGSIGAALAIVLGLIALPKRGWRKSSWTFIKETLLTTVYSTAAIFLLLIAVYFLTRVMTLSRVANDLAAMLVDAGFTATTLLLVLIPFYLVLGMFMDTLSMLLITVPVLAPTLLALDVDLLWFGVFVVILAELGLVTPPIGMLIFIIHNLALDPKVNLGAKINLTDAFKGAIWFVGVAAIVLLLMILVPELATWLPSMQVTR